MSFVWQNVGYTLIKKNSDRVAVKIQAPSELPVTDKQKGHLKVLKAYYFNSIVTSLINLGVV